ncbi:1-(5-phosphoribosyl)-5-[(5-phosphoribosylamino)methylideneamino]imidazole-4-carboxamide isomerase [Vulcaniibacterium thermophilum]|uniref:1-(5-phosphoribosyl)-5-[(5-phosphoribosylamino)methylideneamino] imidazole-4-carboxamide isomerase n=1 Tax=Vulcaniibacterium thermophilum TaxID=1169913 RepID=A0A919DE99_9GAMM|nr:1-(5-phosphoribosyl)-5-[(5-phosphoribosylamino)methylideneamino]imidazole-4-carboxamide isomerase [Vulcaniibacterium thermophilum]GHE38334.1 1-(5-phosphoribosyl)-5-[(5-phosphoribosylamino) methylideneamino] imidazole-4-carboxamide isomerase [Vulcaniibacterium thermophilum]
MTFELYPALDIRGGRVVRLRQGDYAQETRYADEPLAAARAHAEAGARWLHLVDLDAARVGGYTLAPLLHEIRAQTGLRVQTGGGVRSEADVEAILDAGAARVVVGSLAVREPARVARWLGRFGAERLTVALDAREVDGEWRLPVAGWTADSGARLDELLARYADAGLRHLLCTDIACDGMLAGPNLGLYRRVLARVPAVAVQGSGGVRDAADVRALRDAGCAGAVLGRALLEGRLRLDDALREAA